MANPIWPAELPQDVLTEGYEEQLADNLIRTQMDRGPAKVRRDQTAGIRPYRVLTVMDRGQVAAFEDFVETTLEHGALPFDWVSARTGNPVTFLFVIPPAPRIRPQPGAEEWMVEFDLEVLP